ncbi:hypothetical protein BX667DRAFT_536480 [Coemansia mojavensis]|nr:hypothetical protein BX667DRAFT_536480 [Coemansia mojavensis]
MALQPKPCEICTKPRAKYSCPKCKIAYCSLSCYRDKKHEGCTESFYKNQVEEAVKAQKIDEETKKEMQRIVQQYQNQIDQDSLKVHDENSDMDMNENDADASLAERLAGVDLDAEIDDDKMVKIWEALTEKEREEFTSLVNRQQIDAILTPWKPWWYESEKPEISEITNDVSEQTKKSAIPPVLAIGAPVQTLTQKVHPSVIFQLAQISLAYVYMMRHLNGEPYGSNLPVAFTDIITASPLVASKVSEIYNSTHEALLVGFCNIDETMSIASKCTLLSDLLAIYSKSMIQILA